MLSLHYKTKKDLKAAIGTELRFHETSFHGPEFVQDGTVFGVGPDEYSRKWFARVTLSGGKIKAVE